MPHLKQASIRYTSPSDIPQHPFHLQRYKQLHVTRYTFDVTSRGKSLPRSTLHPCDRCLIHSTQVRTRLPPPRRPMYFATRFIYNVTSPYPLRCIPSPVTSSASRTATLHSLDPYQRTVSCFTRAIEVSICYTSLLETRQHP